MTNSNATKDEHCQGYRTDMALADEYPRQTAAAEA